MDQKKGVPNAYTYIYYSEIGKGRRMVMVVDLVDIGFGRWCIWPYFLIRKSDKNTGIAGVFFNYLQNQNKQL